MKQAYTVQKLADLAEVSVRTLHHYDAVGLLKPAAIRQNGYRYYGEEEVNRLQQILYFRELEFSLEEIKQILNSPKYEQQKALLQQKKLLELKRKRLDRLIQIVDNKIKNNNKNMSHKINNKQVFQALNDEEIQKHRQEAKQAYGNTYQDRTKNFSTSQMNELLAQGTELSQRIAKVMQAGNKPEDEVSQKLIAEHFKYMQNFWDCNLEAYKNLGQMYVDDERFTKNIDAVAPGLAQFMRDGMKFYSSNQKSDS